MKPIIYLLTLILGLLSCHGKSNDSWESKSIDTLQSDVRQDTGNVLLSQENSPPTNNSDSLIFFSDSLFAALALELKVISKDVFQGYEKNYKPVCPLDSNGFIKDKGLTLSHFCNEICESYLIDRKGMKFILPSNYDAGIMGLLFSPSCDQFIVYSSYDGPDYSDYYEYRAEIFGFTITQGKGFNAIKPSFQYFTKDWSINKVTWINENSIALKVYEGQNHLRSDVQYKFFKTNLKTK